MSQQEETRVMPFPATDRSPRMIAVASGKGGVGKTWLAAALAQELARLGDRTLLFDGDLGLANADVQLGLTPRRDLGDVIEGRIGLRSAAERFTPGGFDVIAGRSGSVALSNIGAAALSRLAGELAQLTLHYGRIVMDLAAGIDVAVRTLAASADRILVVTSAEPTALTDAYAFIKVTRVDRPAADLQVVVNMADSEREGQRTYGALVRASQTFLGFTPPLAGIIRRDRHVPEAIRAQVTLLSHAPSAEAAQDVRAIAEKLVERA